MIPWIKKYAPKNSAEIINQTEAIQKIKTFILKYPNVPKRALLLYGPPGVGKTSSVYAIARELNYEVVEMNASDVRSARKIHQILDEAMKSRPFFYKGRIILIDEVDGMVGKEDMGGLGAIINIIKNSRWPVILTANDPWDPRFRKIREVCNLIEFKRLSTIDIYKALKRIAAKENLQVDDAVLRALADRAQGDLRSAINDLQTLAELGRPITIKDLEILGYREREKTIFQAMGQMFKATTILGATLPFSEIDMSPTEIVPWIEENIPNEYENLEEIYEAYIWMSNADKFYSRIFRRQYWSLLRYYTVLMYAGVALSKKKRYRKFTRYKMPEYIKKLAQTKNLREQLNKIAQELKEKLHGSTKRIREIYLNTLILFLKNRPDLGKRYARILGLKQPQIEYLLEAVKRL
ncbi:MAG TPA: replication factor C large subunit [Candidatus Nanopusillus sp.]|nr:replication factor C large subunit [Candidatus Nanopusillus sp.]